MQEILDTINTNPIETIDVDETSSNFSFSLSHVLRLEERNRIVPIEGLNDLDICLSTKSTSSCFGFKVNREVLDEQPKNTTISIEGDLD